MIKRHKHTPSIKDSADSNSNSNLNSAKNCGQEILNQQMEKLKLYAAASGDLPNDQVKTCYVCKRNGYPHEAISLEKIIGRTLSNGTNEAIGWKA
jgi:hypothetical protein